MAVESDADRLSMLSDWDTLTVGVTNIAGIFGDVYFEAVDIQGSQPMFHCRVMDLPAITYGTTTGTVNGVTYKIMRTEPDGTGMTNLILQES